jgi:hypothetical protein
MKKIILGFSLLVLATAGFSQQNKKQVVEQNTKAVKIDSVVTVTLPVTYQEKDTLTQKIYSANTSFGFETVIRTANDKNNTPLKQEKDLNKVLNDYIAKIVAQGTGTSSALRVRDTTIGALKAKNFVLKTSDDADNIQDINFTLIYTQDATYTFEYVFPEIRADLVKGEYTAFISSIKLSKELQRNDQYLYYSTGLSAIGKIAIIGGGALVLAFIIILIVRRKRTLQIS